MAAHRLSRLLLLLTEVKTNPWQTVNSLCKTLGIGRAQFYRDKQALKEIEFVFDYSRAERRFLITKDVYVPVYNSFRREIIALDAKLDHELTEVRGTLRLRGWMLGYLVLVTTTLLWRVFTL